MALELNNENLFEAYCKVLVCTGLGMADTFEGCEYLMDKYVLVTVPKSMHDSYPSKLLGCHIKVCTDKPYKWLVLSIEPKIDDNTTFGTLHRDWFIRTARSLPVRRRHGK